MLSFPAYLVNCFRISVTNWELQHQVNPCQVSAMDSVRGRPANTCHIVAVPYPGRGHVNPLMNFCKILASKKPDLLITLVVTEEWVSLISFSLNNPNNLRFSTIPNVIPSELVRNADSIGFIEACLTKMESSFEQLLDEFDRSLKPNLILTDPFLFWVIGVGNRRNIPVASFFPMSSTVFSVFYHLDLLQLHGNLTVDLLQKGNEIVDYIPGVSPLQLLHLPSFLFESNQYILHRTLDLISWIPKSQYLLLTSIYELESQVIDALKAEFSIPVYTIGPVIPARDIELSSSSSNSYEFNYPQWLDGQPENSVLYVSLGSHISVSRAQMDEIAAGLHDSGVLFLWVARDETSRLKQACGDLGLMVPWCDQLQVLSHSSVGGFWTHCGWNSVKEGIFAGVPFLTFPIVADQPAHSKMIVEDWKIGWGMKREGAAANSLVTRMEIARLVQKFMDVGIAELQEMRRRSRELQEICQRAIAEGGTAENDMNAFIRKISQ